MKKGTKPVLTEDHRAAGEREGWAWVSWDQDFGATVNGVEVLARGQQRVEEEGLGLGP